MAENFIGSFGGMREIARKTPELSHAERAVFENIMSYANTQTGRCFPSVTRIANETSVSRYWAGRCLARLEELGHIRRMRRANGRGWEYEICSPLATSQSEAHPAETTEVAETAESVVAPEESRRARQSRPAPRWDPTAQTLTRVLEALDALTGQVEALTGRVEAMERTLARMAESQGVPVEAPKPATPATPAPKSAEGKAKKPEQLFLLPAEGGSTPETEQKPAWDLEDGWKRFWDAWPDHRGKKRARAAFDKVMAKQKDPEAHLQLMLSVIARKKTERTWREGIYMLPATFLNDERWNDEPEKERAGSGGSGGSSSRHGQKLPISDKEAKALMARMEGRVPEDEDEDEGGEEEGGEDCTGVDPEEGLTPEQIEWLNDHPDWR